MALFLCTDLDSSSGILQDSSLQELAAVLKPLAVLLGSISTFTPGLSVFFLFPS